MNTQRVLRGVMAATLLAAASSALGTTPATARAETTTTATAAAAAAADGNEGCKTYSYTDNDLSARQARMTACVSTDGRYITVTSDAECRFDGTIGDLRPDAWKPCNLRNTLEGFLTLNGTTTPALPRLYHGGSVRYEYPGPGTYNLTARVEAQSEWTYCDQSTGECVKNGVTNVFNPNFDADLTVPKTPNLSGTYTAQTVQNTPDDFDEEYVFTVTNTGDEPVHGGIRAQLDYRYTNEDDELEFTTTDSACTITTNPPPVSAKAILTCDLGTIPGHGTAKVTARTTQLEDGRSKPNETCTPWFTWTTTTIDDTATHTPDTEGRTTCGYVERIVNEEPPTN
ncbi:hypothetical protein [Streptomyces sp. NPDC048606]|uniref:hypothetical protein n=1 Tax=Streptomyces sp. NPDC048606 TaxID=3154726 RepID=UPI00342C451C